MSDFYKIKNIAQINDIILNKILIIVSVFGSIVYLLLFVFFDEFVKEKLNLIFLIGQIITILVAIFRNKIPTNIKFSVLLICFIVGRLSNIYVFGILGSGIILISIASILSVIFMNIKYSISLNILIALTIILIYVIKKELNIPEITDIKEIYNSIWIYQIINLIYYSSIIIYVLGQFKNLIIENNNELSEKTELLLKKTIEYNKSEEDFKTIFEQAVDGILIGNSEGIVINANDSICKLTGYSKSEIIGNHISMLFPIAVLEQEPLRFDLIHDYKNIVNERTIKTKGGEFIPIEMTSNKLKDGRLQSFIRDVSYRKETEKVLKDNEARFKSLMLATFEGILVHSENTIIDVNDTFAAMMHCTKEELIGTPVYELGTKESKDIILKKINEKRETLYEVIILRKDNTVFNAEIRAKNMTFMGKDARVASIRDITEKKIIDKSIQNSEITYRELFNATVDAIFIHNYDTGEIIDVNKATLELFGLTRDEFYKCTVSDLSSLEPKYSIEKQNSLFEEVKKKGHVIFEWRCRKKNGDLFWTENTMKIATINGQKRILVVCRDITTRKEIDNKIIQHQDYLEQIVKVRTKEVSQLNEELMQTNETLQQLNDDLHFTNNNLQQQKNELEKTLLELESTQNQLILSEKMTSLGILTAGIAHEINNPINYISSGIDGLTEHLHDIESLFNDYKKIDIHNFNKIFDEIQIKQKSIDIEKSFSTINKMNEIIHIGVNRTFEIITSLKNFTGLDDINYKYINIHEIINSNLVMLYSYYKDNITVHKIFYDKMPSVYCIPGKINQVFMHIITNAIQSINKQGEIFIETSYNLHKNTIFVSIKDTGSGIAKNIINRIYDPFFTTKEVGKNVGLGLTIAHNIINMHKGKIDFFTEIGKGTEFIVTLPVNLQKND